MAITTITYDDKSDLNTTATPSTNKVAAADMNEIKSVVNTNANLQGDLSSLNTTDKSSVVGAINEVEYASVKQTLLWQNTEPNDAFVSQTITLSSSDYDYIEIYFRNDPNNTACFSQRALKGYGTYLFFESFATSSKWVRKFDRTSDTQFSVSNCVFIGDSSTANSQCVPLYVVGYKTNAF